jgi:hypothetical protein
LKSVALRTEHDPIQILWNRGEHLKREANEPNVSVVREAIHSHLIERGEPASFLHVHAAALIALAEAHALKNKTQEFDEAMRATNALIQSALSEDERFVHYSSGESVETGLWSADFSPLAERGADFSPRSVESLADRVEVAIVTFLQKNPNSIYLEIEDDLYPRFTGLLTPSKAMIYAVLDSYAQRDGASLKLRAEDVAFCAAERTRYDHPDA